MSALLPCPFCGSARVEGGVDLERATAWTDFVVCMDCLADGPASPDAGTAATAWNVRAPQPAPAASGDEELRLLRELDVLTRLWEPPAKQRAGIDAIHRRLDAARRGR